MQWGETCCSVLHICNTLILWVCIFLKLKALRSLLNGYLSCLFINGVPPWAWVTSACFYAQHKRLVWLCKTRPTFNTLLLHPIALAETWASIWIRGRDSLVWIRTKGSLYWRQSRALPAKKKPPFIVLWCLLQLFSIVSGPHKICSCDMICWSWKDHHVKWFNAATCKSCRMCILLVNGCLNSALNLYFLWNSIQASMM